MKKIVVNDTNVFIDLCNVELLEAFFMLPWEVHTTEFVMLELLREEQNEKVAKYKTDGRLHIPVFEPHELTAIIELKEKAGVSLTDGSVWYYAKTHSFVLLTGDRKLRQASYLDSVEVHGIIYVFDELVAEGILPPTMAIDKLKDLQKSNPRLPKDEIDKRIELWNNQLDKEG